MSLVLALLSGLAGAAECPERDTEALHAKIEAAHGLFTKLDIDGFKVEADAAMEALTCVADPLSKHAVADVHRLQGLRQAVGGNPVGSAQAFGAARSLEPAFTFPESMVPAGSPVLADYDTLPIDTGTFETLAPSQAGTLQIDGRARAERPLNWPALVQFIDGEGALVETAYLWPGDPMIGYDPATETEPIDPIELLPPPPPPKPATGGPNLALLAGAGAAAALSAGLYGVSSAKHREWADLDTSDARAEELRPSVNSTAIGSGLAGVAAVGLAVGVAVTW